MGTLNLVILLITASSLGNHWWLNTESSQLRDSEFQILNIFLTKQVLLLSQLSKFYPWLKSNFNSIVSKRVSNWLELDVISAWKLIWGFVWTMLWITHARCGAGGTFRSSRPRLFPLNKWFPDIKFWQIGQFLLKHC